MPAVDLSRLREVKVRDYLIRFALGAVISMGAALITKAGGAHLGGLFLAFPAILPASLTLIEQKEGTRRADRNAVGAVLGGLGLSVFAGIAEKTPISIPPFVALVIALIGWVVTSLSFYALLAFFRPEDCEKSSD
jgi:hypothetical protein